MREVDGTAPTERQIETWPIGRLRPNPRNARTHSKPQLEQLRRCIQNFGFINPVLAQKDGLIIAGHGRVEAAKLLGMQKLPVLPVDHLTPKQIRLFALADNKIAENAGWDTEILKLELQELSQCSEIELELTGFPSAEIDLLILDAPAAQAEDNVPPIDERKPAISRPGDVWQIGDHRLTCGDATDPGTYKRLMDGRRARQVFTDPPWNVPIQGHVSGLGKNKHPEFQMASGEMTVAEFKKFLETAFRHLADASEDGSLHYICMDWRHLEETLAAGRTAYTGLKNICVWNKTNGGMGSLYRSQHELVLVFKRGQKPHLNNVELGKHGRYRSNVWTYPGQNAFGNERDNDLADHPTIKPTQLVADAILDSSRRGDIVLDAFCGSGTTLMAAQTTGRCGYGIELSPHYVDLAIRRLKERHNLTATHVSTGKTFSRLATARV